VALRWAQENVHLQAGTRGQCDKISSRVVCFRETKHKAVRIDWTDLPQSATFSAVLMNSAPELTYTGIGLAVFAQPFCLPVPSMLLLMTTGALAAQGQGHLHLSLVLISAVVGCLLADGFWFWLGRRWGSGVIRLVCSLASNPKQARMRADRVFDKWGLRLLLIAKFVPGLDGVSPPLAGASGATVSGFLLHDAAGSLLWSGAYVLLGLAFSQQMFRVLFFIEHFGRFAAILVGVPFLVFILWRGFHLVQIIRHLRLRRISPAMLQRKLDDSDKVAVFDLLDYEAQEGSIKGITGAVRVDPARLRKAPKVNVPTGVDVVLYCSSRNELVSARVAEALQKRGFSSVWVLEGGLDAWVQEGRPVTEELCTPESIAARLGIILPPHVP
jgi:membrane protein DedA with SNARE-associated domain/rhodanese-related sulfurtransferase